VSRGGGDGDRSLFLVVGVVLIFKRVKMDKFKSPSVDHAWTKLGFCLREKMKEAGKCGEPRRPGNVRQWLSACVRNFSPLRSNTHRHRRG
jgi:hypothetical protein